MKRLITIVLLGLSSFCFAYEEKPIVVVIPSYNNAQWYERNLNSVCFQNYKNYRIIYIDDCSPDGTGNLVRAYIEKHGLQNKITLICNATNCGAMANHYKAVWMCKDYEIIVHYDGDDFFKHNNVLARINLEYQNPDVWLTYGQFERFPSRVKGYCTNMPASVIQRNVFREHTWITSHVRTFYAGLFKQIKLRDFIYEGNYFDITCDLAMMFPLLELAGTHIRFIPDILYIYNEATPINDYKKNLIRQMHCEKVIRSKTKYKPAQSYITGTRTLEPIDMVLFSVDAVQAERILNRVINDEEPVNAVIIFYAEENSESFDQLRSLYADCDLVQIYPEKFMREYFDSMRTHPGYFLFATGDCEIQNPLLLSQAVQTLEHAHALSLNFTLGKEPVHTPFLDRLQKVPSLVTTPDGCYAWQFAQAEYDWRQPFAFTMNLCKKVDIMTLLEGARYSSFFELQHILQHGCVDLNEIGLCFEQAKVSLKR